MMYFSTNSIVALQPEYSTYRPAADLITSLHSACLDICYADSVKMTFMRLMEDVTFGLEIKFA